MGDIFSTGPVGLKGLTGLNNTQYSFGLNNKLLSPEETTNNTPEFKSALQSANEAVNDNIQSQFDEQMIDTGVNRAKDEQTVWDQPEIDDIQNYRAYRQSALSKIANGVNKAGVLTATTFLNNTVGAVAGLVGMIDNDEETNYWNNPFSQAMKSVNDWSEKVMPNFYSTEEQEHPFKITANSIGDKVIKNLGFTAGSMLAAGAMGNAIASGAGRIAQGITTNAVNNAMQATNKAAGMIDKASKAAGKLENFNKLEKLIGMNKNVPALVTEGTAALYGALGEGAFEALNNSEEWAKAEHAKYDGQFKDRENAIIAKYQANQGKSLLMNPETGRAIDGAYLEYMQEMQQLEQDRASMDDLIKERAKRMGNIDMALNIPILTASNIMQFGKQLAGGFKYNAAKAGQNASRFANMPIDEAIATAKKEGLDATTFLKEYAHVAPKSTKRSKIIDAIKNSAMEGVEEISQSMASAQSGIYEEKRLDREYEYIEAGKDPKLANEQNSWIADFASSMIEGAGDTLKDKEAWSEFFVGALTGALGAPAVGAGAKNAAINFTIGANEEKGRKGLTIGWGGGIYGGIKEGMDELAEEQALADKANEVINSPTFKAIYEGKIRHDIYDAQKANAALEGDRIAYDSAEIKQLAADVAMADKTGQLDVLEQAMQSLYDTTSENIQAFREQFKEQMIDAAGNKLSDEEVIDMMQQQKEASLSMIKEFKVASNLVETTAAQYGVDLDDDTKEMLTWKRAVANQYRNKANFYGRQLGRAFKGALDSFKGYFESANQILAHYPEITSTDSDEFKKLSSGEQKNVEFALNLKALNEDLNAMAIYSTSDNGNNLGDIASNDIAWSFYKPRLDLIVDVCKELGHQLQEAPELIDSIKSLADKSVEWRNDIEKKLSSKQSLEKVRKKVEKRDEVKKQQETIAADQKAINTINTQFPFNGSPDAMMQYYTSHQEEFKKVGGMRAYANSLKDATKRAKVVDLIKRSQVVSKLQSIVVDGDVSALGVTADSVIMNGLQDGSIAVEDIRTIVNDPGWYMKLNKNVTPKQVEEAQKVISEKYTDALLDEFDAMDEKSLIGNAPIPTTAPSQQSSPVVEEVPDVNDEDMMNVTFSENLDGDDDGNEGDVPVIDENTTVVLGNDLFGDEKPADKPVEAGGQTKRDDNKDDLKSLTWKERTEKFIQQISNGEGKVDVKDAKSVANALKGQCTLPDGTRPTSQVTLDDMVKKLTNAIEKAEQPFDIMEAMEKAGFLAVTTPECQYVLMAYLTNHNATSDDKLHAKVAQVFAEQMVNGDGDITGLFNEIYGIQQTNEQLLAAEDQRSDAALVAATASLPTVQNATPVTTEEVEASDAFKAENAVKYGRRSERSLYTFNSGKKETYSDYLSRTKIYPSGIESAEDKAAYLAYVKAWDEYATNNNVERNIKELNNSAINGDKPSMTVRKVTLGSGENSVDVPVIFWQDKPVGTLPTEMDLKIINATTGKKREDMNPDVAALSRKVLAGEEATITYDKGMGGTYYRSNAEQPVSAVMSKENANLELTIPTNGQVYATSEKHPNVSNKVPGRVFATVRSSNGSMHPAMLKALPISSVGNDYFENMLNAIPKLMKSKSFTRGHYMTSDAHNGMNSNDLSLLRDIVQTLGVNGAVSFGMMSSNGKYHDMTYWRGRHPERKFTNANANAMGIHYSDANNDKQTLVIKFNRDGSANIDNAYIIEQIKQSSLAENWVNASLQRLSDPKYLEMMSKYLTFNLESFETINDWFTYSIPEESPKDDTIEEVVKPANPLKKDGANPYLNILKGRNNGLNLSNIKTPQSKSLWEQDMRKTEANSKEVMSTEEMTKRNIERVKKMIPSLSDEHVKIVHDGVIRTIDRHGNPVEAWGRFKDGVIEVCSESPVGTAYHEAFHYVTNTLMDPFTLNDMYALASQRYGVMSPLELEEHLAEDFRDFMNGYDDTSLKGKLRNMFTNLKMMVQSLFNNRMTLDRMFYDIMRGRMAYYNGNMNAKVYQEEYDRAKEITNIDNYEKLLPMLHVTGSFAQDLAIVLADISHGDEMAVGIERLMISGQLFTRYDNNLSLVHCMAFNLTEGYSESLFESMSHLNLPEEKHQAYQKAVRDRLNQYFDAHPDVYHMAQRLSSLTTAQRYLLAEHANNDMLGKNTYRYIAERYGMKPYVYYGVNDAMKSLFSNNEAYKSADQIYSKVNKLIDISSKLGTKVAFAPSYMDHTLEGMTTSTANPLVIIYIDPSMSDGAIARAAIHELTHSITNTALEILDNDELSDEQKLERFGEAGISYDQIDAIEDLYDLFVDMNDTYDESNKIPYGMTSIQEFVSELTSGEGKGQFREIVQTRMKDDPSFLSDAMNAVERFIDGHTQNSINDERKYNVKINDALNKHYSLAFNKYRQRKIDDILNSADGEAWMQRIATNIDEIHQLPIDMQEQLTFCM